MSDMRTMKLYRELLLFFVVLLCAGDAFAQSSAISAAQAQETVTSLISSSTPSGGLTCSFNITGNFTNATPQNTTGSVNVDSAALNCTGGTLDIIGGPALQTFSASFSGVNYTLSYNLPGATVAVRNQAVTFLNSNFINLTPNGEASLILITSNVTFQTANFSSNKQATAGAIHANGSSNVAILNSTFLNNTGSNAGAISIFNSSIFINGSTFMRNAGRQGGGVLFQNGSTSAIRIASSLFMRNNATTGGGVFAQDCAQAILYNNVLTQNQANGSGGAIFQLNCGGALVLNSVTRNNATAGGGAYINTVPSLTMERNEWSANTAAIGSGGVDLQTVSNATVTREVFSQNRGQQGGAYFGTSTACQFRNCTFANNTATLNGGGIFRTEGSGDVSYCLFQGNSAGKLGGGLYDSQVSGNILNNVFEQNKAGSSQGAALFRLQSSGNIDSNRGLTSDNYVDQLPSSSTGGLAVAG